jgi:hypothetical protein
VKRISAADGAEAWRIDCSASVESDCRFEADRTCPSGYQVLTSDDRGLTMRCRPAASPPADDATATGAQRQPAPPDELAPVPSRRPAVRHGFFARAGFGWGNSQSSETLADGAKESFDGSGLAFDASAGTAVSPIILLGGTFAFQHVPSPQITYGGRDATATADASFSVLGVSMQAYASKTSGLHFGGVVGYGSLTAPDPYGLPAKFRASGIGYGAEIGYSTPLGDRWHVGGKLRLLGAATSYGTVYRFEAQNTWALALMGDVMSL